MVAETIRTARASGAGGLLIVRADSAFYNADVITACRALDARFSITVRMNTAVKAAIAGIDESAWTPIKYPQAVRDEEGQCWISDAETAETAYAAFTSKPRKQQVTATEDFKSGETFVVLWDLWCRVAAFGGVVDPCLLGSLG